jgi:predicted Rossmann fold nucleotide-binding protein DprA/Smf involved in DNA uptake
MEGRDGALWLALAYRSLLGEGERRAVAQGPGPDPSDFPEAVLARERGDAKELEDLGVRLLALPDEEYPARLRRAEGPLLLQVAGRPSLLAEEGVKVLAGVRGAAAGALQETLDSGGRAVVVLSKGMLQAKSLLRALAEPIADGALALVTAEPPRATWGPLRDRRRDALARLLSTG